MDIFQWSFTTFRKKRKKKKRLFLRRSNFQPWRSIGDIWLKRCKFSAKRDTINPRLKIGEHSDGDNNLGQWEEGEREGGRGGKTIRSTIRLNFCLHWHMDGISIVERPLAWPGKKKERERERERWPFKSPRRSFIERVERSVFPIRHESFRRSHENFTLPFLPPCFSLSSFLQPLVALHLNSPSKEVLPWWIFSVMSGRCSRSINVIHRPSPSQIVRVTNVSKIATGTKKGTENGEREREKKIMGGWDIAFYLRVGRKFLSGKKIVFEEKERERERLITKSGKRVEEVGYVEELT